MKCHRLRLNEKNLQKKIKKSALIFNSQITMTNYSSERKLQLNRFPYVGLLSCRVVPLYRVVVPCPTLGANFCHVWVFAKKRKKRRKNKNQKSCNQEPNHENFEITNSWKFCHVSSWTQTKQKTWEELIWNWKTKFYRELVL